MRGESVAKHSRRLVYILTELDRALKRAVNVPRRKGINYEAMDVERGSDEPSWTRPRRILRRRDTRGPVDRPENDFRF